MNSSNTNNSSNNFQTAKKYSLVFILILYILGIFMGALDTGIVSPARTIIQNSLGVDDKTGIWMITIYTLAYASIIPISGKLADKFGRKYIYIVSVALFGVGSSICAFSYFFTSFPILLTGRVIQAIGGGGIMPIATAEFGTSFPKEKRGMALGLVGATFGVANILGSTIGSALLSIFGNENWRWLFFINVPVCIIIVFFGLIVLPNSKSEFVKKIDKLGTLIIVGIILSLLYGLKNIDFFNFISSIKSVTVYPYLIVFVILIPIFIFIEKKAKDPIINLSYFSNPRIIITLILAIISGIGMMGMVFVPQFAENALKYPAGTGGYFVAILGVFAGISAPVSGNMIDKFGAKIVLLIGFMISMIGALFLAFVAVKFNNILSISIGLIFMGLGVGFTMGAPLNYMMLGNTDAAESNSALSTLSLIRSIGTAISPAIMIGFIAHAGLSVQPNLMAVMPVINPPVISEMAQLKTMINTLKADPKTSDMLKNVTLPNLDQPKNIDINLTSGTLPNDLAKKMQSADVTNITQRTKELAETMYDKNVPSVITRIQTGVQSGIDNMQDGLDGISKGEANLGSGISGVTTAVFKMDQGIDGLNTAINKMQDAVNQQDIAIKQMDKLYTTIKNSKVNNKFSGSPKPTSMPSNGSIDINALKAKISKLTIAKNELSSKVAQSVIQKQKLESAVKATTTKKDQMDIALVKIKDQKLLLGNALNKTKQLKQAVPPAFDKSKKDYLNNIELKRPELEEIFQSTLNGGFKQMYITVFFINLIAFVVLLFYKKPSNLQ